MTDTSPLLRLIELAELYADYEKTLARTSLHNKAAPVARQAIAALPTLRQLLSESSWQPIEDPEVAIWQAIKNIEFGSKTDDKLIRNELHKLGYCICRKADK